MSELMGSKAVSPLNPRSWVIMNIVPNAQGSPAWQFSIVSVEKSCFSQRRRGSQLGNRVQVLASK